MDIASMLAFLESSSLAVGIRDSRYLFPLLECLHVVALALVFGTIAVIDFRLLGLASLKRPFSRVKTDMLKWTWAGFGLSVITGALMFTTNAAVYYGNFYFRTKMVLLALSGINMMLFELTAGRTLRHWDTDAIIPRAARTAALASLLLWVGVIFMGRWIGYTTSDTEVGLDPGISAEDLFPFPADGGFGDTPENGAPDGPDEPLPALDGGGPPE